LAAVTRRQYSLVSGWPSSPAELVGTQLALASALPAAVVAARRCPRRRLLRLFERGQSGTGHAGDRALAAAALAGAVSVIEDAAGAAYEA
jgi:hypothetical protein